MYTIYSRSKNLGIFLFVLVIKICVIAVTALVQGIVACLLARSVPAKIIIAYVIAVPALATMIYDIIRLRQLASKKKVIRENENMGAVFDMDFDDTLDEHST